MGKREATSLGKKLAALRWKGKTALERSQAMTKLASKVWEGMTPEERKAEAKRRFAGTKGKAKRKKASRASA